MTDSGYESYQDSRLQPPDIDAPTEEETSVGSYHTCSHRHACLRMLKLKNITDFELMQPDDEEIADYLGCEWCEEYDDGAWMQRRCRERIDALRSECARLLGIVRMAESENDVCYVNHEFTERLRSLGVEVGDE